eukprot:5082998-Alexandrium_andersonii.AAC.1
MDTRAAIWRCVRESFGAWLRQENSRLPRAVPWTFAADMEYRSNEMGFARWSSDAPCDCCAASRANDALS